MGRTVPIEKPVIGRSGDSAASGFVGFSNIDTVMVRTGKGSFLVGLVRAPSAYAPHGGERRAMPTFPRKENDVLSLVNNMISGYTDHAADFPSCDVVGLTAARDAYVSALNAQADAAAAAKIATETKNSALRELEKTAQTELKKSEADCADNPQDLEYIGWGPRQTPQPTDPPGQVRDLDITFQGRGLLTMDWKAPASGEGGPVRSYVIERRDKNGENFTAWAQVSVAVEKEAALADQPQGIQLEYRVKAINTNGSGVESNTVACVL